jgi:hypothetical protein
METCIESPGEIEKRSPSNLIDSKTTDILNNDIDGFAMRLLRRHHLINRYESGQLSTAERERFHSLLARDEKLRAMYDTEEMIKSTLGKDRAAIPYNHAATESKVLASLGAAFSPGGSTVPGSTDGISALSTGGTAMLTTTAKLIISIVAGLGITAGVLWYAIPDSSADFNGRKPAIQQSVPGTAPETPAVLPDTKRERTAQPGSIDRRIEEGGAASTPAATGISHPERKQAVDAGTASEKARSHSVSEGSAVYQSDSVRVKLKLETKRLRQEKPEDN